MRFKRVEDCVDIGFLLDQIGYVDFIVFVFVVLGFYLSIDFFKIIIFVFVFVFVGEDD